MIKNVVTYIGLLCILTIWLCTGCSASEGNQNLNIKDEGLDRDALVDCEAGSREILEDNFACVLKDSGLRVIVASLPSAGNTTVSVVYGAGTGDEGPGESGAAHLIEHLLYHGTKKYPDPKKALRRIGAAYNASTTLDATTYRSIFPAGDDSVRLVLDIEMDRMGNSRIETLDLDAERRVVRNELESSMGGGDGLQAELRDIVYDAAFPHHGYGRASRQLANLNNLSASELDDFYRRHYRPDNSTIVIAGPVKAENVVGWVSSAVKHNAPRRPFSAPEAPDNKEGVSANASPRRENRIVARHPGTQAAIAVFFRSFPATHPDHPVLSTLGNVLVSGPEARLQKLLVAPGLATRVSAVDIQKRDGGGLFIVVEPSREQDPHVVQQILLKGLRDLGSGETQVSLEEADRARGLTAKIPSSSLAGTSIHAANRISGSVALGDWRLSYVIPKALAAVTVDDLNRVAQSVIDPGRQTTVALLPVRPSSTPAASQAAGHDTSWIDRFAALRGSSAGNRAKNKTGAERSQDSPTSIKKRFDEFWSMDATVEADARYPRGFVVGNLLLRLETPAQQTSDDNLLLHMLLPDLLFGTEAFGTEVHGMPVQMGRQGEIRLEQVAALGLQSLSIERAPLGWFVLNFSGDLKDVVRALKILDAHAKALRRDSQLIRRITDRYIQAHTQNMKNPFQVGLDTSMAFLNSTYAPNDLRRLSVPNLRTSLESLTLADVKAFATSVYLTKGHLVIAGNIEMSDFDAFMKTGVIPLSGRWPFKPGREDKPGRIRAPSKATQKHIRIPDASHTAVVVASATKHGLKEKDLYTLKLSGEILNARISDRLRQQGMAYHHTAMFSPSPGENSKSLSGNMVLGAVTSPAQADLVAEILRKELKTLRERGVSDDELTGAKGNFTNIENIMGPSEYWVSEFTQAYLRNAPHLESIHQWRVRNATMLDRLTASDINAALNGYLIENISVTVTAGSR